MFKIGSPVKGSEFIDRLKHIPVFQNLLKSGQHVTIKAPRRFGKTSLVKHVLEHIGGHEFIYIDIRRVSSLEQLANSILDSAYKITGIQDFIYKAKNASIELFKSIQSIKIEHIGEVTLRMKEGTVDEMELFLHSLDVVEKIGQRNGSNIVFVMDEFQDMANLGDKHTFDKMRSVMQHHEHVTYVFLGSVESMMTYIFENKASPFFHFSYMMKLKGLDVEEVFEYCEAFFKWHHYKLIEDDLRALIEFLGGHPDYTAQTLQRIYFSVLQNPKRVIDRTLCIESLSAVFMDNKAYIEELISKAKTKKHHYEVIQSVANNIVIDLSSATLFQVRSSLENMGLIEKIDRGEYVLVDIFLKLYLNIEQTSELAVSEFLLKRINGHSKVNVKKPVVSE